MIQLTTANSLLPHRLTDLAPCLIAPYCDRRRQLKYGADLSNRPRESAVHPERPNRPCLRRRPHTHSLRLAAQVVRGTRGVHVCALLESQRYEGLYALGRGLYVCVG
jgi:hypothetical protein